MTHRVQNLMILTLPVAFMLSGKCQGQTSPQSPAVPSATITEVVVVGSYIRKNATTPESSPIEVIDQTELQQMAVPVLGDVVKNLTVNAGTPFGYNLAQAAGAPNRANFDLRGLGLNDTLVLINGRRIEGGAVDVNLLPLNMVGRTEILKDGSSALYGSDAVAGVVNLVTRKVDGVEIDATYQTTTQLGAETGDTAVNFALGDGGESWHFDMFGTLFHRSESRSPSRFVNPPLLLPIGFPGSFTLATSPTSGPYAGAPAGTTIADPTCAAQGGVVDTPSGIPGNPFNTGNCEVNFKKSFQFVPEENAFTSFVRGEHSVNDRLKIFSEFSFAATHTFERQAETEALEKPPELSLQPPLLVPATNPFNPFGVPVYMNGAPTGATRLQNIDEHFWRVAIGASYDFANNWHAEAAYMYSDYSKTFDDNSTIISRTQDALNGVGGQDGNQTLNPFGSNLTSAAANPQSLIYFLAPETFRNSFVTMQTADAHVTGDLAQLPAGPLGFAAGVQYRENGEANADDAVVTSRDQAALPPSPVSNRHPRFTDVSAGFTELAVPITRTLDVNAAVRYEAYGKGIGSTTNYKFALGWRPFEMLTIRGTYGTSFRAPLPGDLDPSETVSSTTTGTNPYSGTAGKCDGTAFLLVRTFSVGNPDLKPEKSENANVGFTLRPMKELAFDVDAWHIRYKDVFARTNAQAIINDDCNSGNRNDPRVTYDSQGNPVSVDVALENLSSVVTDGVDLGIRFTHEVGWWGQVGLSNNSTYINSFEIEAAPGAPVVQGAGSRNLLNQFRTIPKLRSNTILEWTRNQQAANIIVRYIGKFQDDLTFQEVPSFTTLDVQYSYSFESPLSMLRNLTLAVGAINVLGRSAPVLIDEPWGYDSSVHDPRGRMVYASLRSKW
jgi:iron complex outermembrane receptor protein